MSLTPPPDPLLLPLPLTVVRLSAKCFNPDDINLAVASGCLTAASRTADAAAIEAAAATAVCVSWLVLLNLARISGRDAKYLKPGRV